MHKPPVSVGWEFESADRALLKRTPIKFTTTGNYSADYGREVTKSVTGFVLLPEDRVNLATNLVFATLVLDDVRHPMGTFMFTEDVMQKDVVLDFSTGESADLTNVALSDISTLLLRNDGTPETLNAGFSPTAEIERLIQGAGIGPSVEAGYSANTQSVTWDGSTTDLAKVRQLAELAGHRPPWMDNEGVMRSVSASRVFGTVLEFEKDIFVGEKGSVSVTSNYLTVPNRVIVTSNSSTYKIRGQWDAPSSWLSSEAQRGYVRTVTEEVQGLQSDADAERVAATIGRRLSARKLTAKIFPTHLLDGPRVIRYDDALWTVQSWSGSTSPGSLFDFEAEELFEDTPILSAPATIPGVI